MSRFIPLLLLSVLCLAPGALALGADEASATNTPAAAVPTGAANDGGIPTGSVTMTGNVITGLSVKDPTKLTDADYKKIAQMQGLQKLDFGKGFPASGLKAIAGLPALESFSTNGSELTDADIPTFATFKNLQALQFFHPNKGLTGATFPSLASLPNLQGISVGGSTTFGDAAMAGIAQLPHIENLRSWHSAVTIEGVKSLTALKGLKSLMLGQRLAQKPPATLSDDAVAVLAQIPSLESLDLEEARLSLPALEKLKQLPNLKRLSLKGVDISEADIATLKKELPKVTVSWTAPDANAMHRINALFGAAAGGPAASSASPTDATPPKQP
jgi:hypothetical protein